MICRKHHAVWLVELRLLLKIQFPSGDVHVQRQIVLQQLQSHFTHLWFLSFDSFNDSSLLPNNWLKKNTFFFFCLNHFFFPESYRGLCPLGSFKVPSFLFCTKTTKILVALLRCVGRNPQQTLQARPLITSSLMCLFWAVEPVTVGCF